MRPPTYRRRCRRQAHHNSASHPTVTWSDRNDQHFLRLYSVLFGSATGCLGFSLLVVFPGVVGLLIKTVNPTVVRCLVCCLISPGTALKRSGSRRSCGGCGLGVNFPSWVTFVKILGEDWLRLVEGQGEFIFGVLPFHEGVVTYRG